mmetsp:Transcript_275/g.371  ORF Transcript_275/g.371 Transcript_275/m.371 type:complete len:581 (+) Transcript_275:64-1806(+)
MAKPKQIINDPKYAVEEFVHGLLKQFPNNLVKLQNHNVLLKASRRSQVQLLSGGGSGHEPSHAGWVGEGMLTGAILGGIFASPSVVAILGAIRCAAGTDKSDAVLLIVKNYTGDRLNFGMACEKANLEGIDCQMVVVADDCALERSKGITGARGVAGTVLVHKIAGAAAAIGMSLSEVSDLAKVVCSRMGTMGVALNAVTVPGASEVNDRLDESTIEIGLGIHGEAGMKKSPMLTSDEIAKELLSKIESYGRKTTDEKIIPMFNSGDSLCLLVNNLGGSSNFELSILANSAVQVLEVNYGCKVTRLLVGSFMTSFNMHGASLTVLNLTDAPSEVIECLDAATTAPAWIPVDVAGSQTRPSDNEIPEFEEAVGSFVALNKPELEGSFWGNPENLIRKAATALAEAEPILTKYDTIVGDGDCGITMKRGADKVLAGNIIMDHPVGFFASLADAVSASMGGTSGVLLELMFSKMASRLSRDTKIGPTELANAFMDGVQAVSLYGGATVGARTMLDALFPAANELLASGSLKEAAAKARTGANATATMRTASAGRSNYLSESTLDGTPDPGAVAAAIVLEALWS